MVGGYMSFSGIDGKARYAGTAVEEVLPVTIDRYDDRVEAPEGVRVKAGARLVASVGDDPLVVAWSHGRGRAMAFTSDCGPHWAPPQFVSWSGYARLWTNAVDWLIERKGE